MPGSDAVSGSSLDEAAPALAPLAERWERWRRMLAGDALFHEYFASRGTCHGAVLMTCPQSEVFSMATVDDVPFRQAESTLAAIVDHFRRQGITPRVRLSPFADARWPALLNAAGFIETEERRRFWLVRDPVDIAPAPAVSVRRVATPQEADRFSAIQTAGFQVPEDELEWDRQLMRRRLGDASAVHYLGRLGAAAVGTGAIFHLANGSTCVWGLATLPEARHHGVGFALLQRMTADALAAPGRPVFLTTAWANPIEAVYVKLGFVPEFRARMFAWAR